MAITAETRTDIIELVVGMFDAAPGASVLSELAVSVDAGLSLKDLAITLGNTSVFTDEYPAFLTNAEFATKYLTNFLGGNPGEVTAENFALAEEAVVALLNSGKSRGEVVYDVVTAVSAVAETDTNFGTAAALLNNQTEVAVHYSVTTQQSGDTLDDLKSVIVNVTSSDATVTTAKAAVDNTNNQGTTFTLVTSVDDLTGTTNNDTFVALQSGGTDETFGAADTINGGAGTDTIKITNTEAAALNIATVSSVETVEYRSTGGGGTIDMANFADATTLIANRTAGAADINNIKVATALSFTSSTATMNTTATYTGDTGTADSASVTFNGVVDGAELDFAGAVETMNLSTTGAASRFDNLVFDAGTTTLNIAADEALTVDDTFTAAGVTKLTATGDSKVTLTPALANTVVTIDSSAQTDGGLSVTTGNPGDTNGDLIDLTFTGGAGADSVNITNTDAADEVSVSTGAGNDTVTIAGLAMDGSKDIINGGDGTDTLAINLAAALTSTTVKSISNFETLSLSDAGTAATNTYDMSLLSGLTGLKIGAISADAAVTVNKISATQAANVSVSGTQSVDLTLGVTDAATVGQLDTLSITVSDGSSTVNTITFADLSAAGVETINLTATDSITFTAITGLTGMTKMDVGGAGAINLTSGALALNTNTSLDFSDVTGTVTVDISGTTTNGAAVKGSATKANEITGSNQTDAFTGGTGIDTIHTSTGTDTVDLVDDGAADVIEFEAATGRTTVSNFDAASEDVIDIEIAAFNTAEVEVTAAAAQAAATNGSYYVVEQKVGTAASLTTGGTETIADFTDVADVAAFLGERFTNNGVAGFGVILNDGTNSYLYSVADAGPDADLTGEVTLIGVFNAAVLDDADVSFS